ncbi:MAG: WD40 repeat domain-containing protein [Nitrospirae bacterium]|nr:WD40 repeat domain-containing protein [Nitrospirota bacterium]
MRIFQNRTFITWAIATLMVGIAVSGNSAVYAYEKPEVFVQMGHSGEITSMAISPDGRYMLSGSQDTTIKLWDVSTGREVRTFQGHSGFVNSVAFSPDGRYAVSGSTDKTIKFWDVSTGREVRTFQGHSDEVTCVAFSPDGQYVLSGGGDIKLWEVSTGRRVKRVFWGQSWRVYSLAFSPDGKYALSGSEEGIKLWDVSTGKEVRRFGGHSFSVAFSPDGKYALSGGWDKTVKLWDVSTGREVRRFEGHTSDVRSVAFSPNGRYVLSGSNLIGGDGIIRFWEVSSGKEVVKLIGSSPVAFSPDGRYALWKGTDLFDKTIRLWDLSTGKEARRFQGYSDEIISVALSPDGKYALSGGRDETIKLWDISTGRQVRSIKGHSRWVNSVNFSPDSKYALSGSTDKTIKLWEISTGREVRIFTGHPDSVYSVTFSPDGKYVLSGGGETFRGNNNNTIKLWEVSTGNEVKTFQGEPGAVRSVAFSSDGRYALSGTRYNIKLWDVSTGKEVKRFERPSFHVAFSPDGRYALSSGGEDYTVVGGGKDYTIKLWDVHTGKELRRFKGHAWWVTSFAFSPDGRYALSGGWDSAVKLWEVSTGKEVRTFHGHADRITSVVFSPDGRYALSGGEGGTTKIWNTATGKEICMMVGFKDGEWVVITPEGYFNASKNGPAHLNVRLGNRVFGLDQFYDVFYRPDIVEAKLKGEDITTLASTNLEEALKNPPPSVEFVTVFSESSDSKVNIKYKIASSGGGIGEVRLFHNGKLIQSDGFYRQAKTAPTGTATLLAFNTRAIKDELRSVVIVSRKDKKLSPIESTPKGDIYEGTITVDAISGDNDISLAAFNRNNTVQSILKTATFKSTLKPEDSHLYVLSVGIDEYKSIISQTIKPMDVFVLFIASHGVLQSGLYSIVTHDYDGNLSGSNVINSNEIMEISKNMKALTQIFILDTCHAGGLDNFVSGLYDARMTVLARNMGLHMFASASSTEEALDGYKGKNGMFTYTLLEGLNNNNNTDTNKDGKVSIYELGAYAREQTVKYSKETGHSQTPVINDFGKDVSVYVIR